MRPSFHKPFAALALAAFAAFPVLAFATAAPAQVRGIRPPAVFQEAFKADFERRDLVVFQEVLGLEPNLVEVITTLYNDYDVAYREGAKSARERMNALRPQRPKSARQIRSAQEQVRKEIDEMRQAARDAAAAAGDAETAREIMDDYETRLRERMTELQNEMHTLGFTAEGREDLGVLLEEMSVVAGEWNEAGDRLAAEFVANTLSLLSAEQAARWPIVERRLRREKTIARGKLSGESVNLVAIAADLELDDDIADALAPVFETYELRLDDALRARNDYMKETADQIFQATQLGVTERIATLAERQIDLNRDVRDINEEYIPAIAAGLPEEAARRFQDAANRTGFPRVYRPTAAARILKSAARMSGIDEGQREAIIALESEYLLLLVDQNTRLRRTILSEEPLVQKQQYVYMGTKVDRGNLEILENPIRRAFDERRAFGDTYIERLRTMLPPDVFRRIPGATRSAVTRGGEGGSDRSDQ